MEKEEKKIFLKYKENILENLSTLRINLEQCEEYGMEDLEETTYNQIIDLEDELQVAETISELSDIIDKSKVIESKIDYFYESKGISSMGLTWPDI